MQAGVLQLHINLVLFRAQDGGAFEPQRRDVGGVDQVWGLHRRLECLGVLQGSAEVYKPSVRQPAPLVSLLGIDRVLPAIVFLVRVFAKLDTGSDRRSFRLSASGLALVAGSSLIRRREEGRGA